MKQTLGYGLLLAAFLSASTMAARDIDTKDFSGWMDSYDSLVFNEDTNSFVFFNDDKRGQYQKVILESVAVYARNAKTEAGIATQATDYITAGARKLLEERGILADEAGPGVLRYRMAITGVEKSAEELKAHNLIPVSALFRGAKAVTGNLATYVDTMFEAELVDSVTGEQVAATVRKGITETEKKTGDNLRFDDVKPTLDLWLEAYARTLDDFLAKR